MEKFRIGNDLSVFWAIQDKDDRPFPLEGKDVRLFVTHPRGRVEVTDEIEIQDNVICWEFKGVSQKYLGTYKLTAEIRTSPSTRVVRKDIQEAFALVSESVYEDSEGTPPLVNENDTIYLSSVLDVYRIMPIIPQIGPNGNWWIDGVDTGKPGAGLQYAIERTVYPSQIFYWGQGSERIDLSDEERAYNVETYKMAVMDLKPVFLSVGGYFLPLLDTSKSQSNPYEGQARFGIVVTLLGLDSISMGML